MFSFIAPRQTSSDIKSISDVKLDKDVSDYLDSLNFSNDYIKSLIRDDLIKNESRLLIKINVLRSQFIADSIKMINISHKTYQELSQSISHYFETRSKGTITLKGDCNYGTNERPSLEQWKRENHEKYHIVKLLMDRITDNGYICKIKVSECEFCSLIDADYKYHGGTDLLIEVDFS